MNGNNPTNHPLEGKYIVYHFGIQDYAGEGWALALFRLSNGRMKQIYHPWDRALYDDSEIGEEHIDEVIRLTQRKGIKEVYSVFHLDDFFGIPAGWISLHEKGSEPEEIELWAEYKCIGRGSPEHRLLTEHGIEVKFYEEPRT